MSLYKAIRPVLFNFDAELTHQMVMKAADRTLGTPAGRLVKPLFTIDDPRLRVRLWDLEFDNPVGLAAGFDKNAEHIHALSRFGFGHIEVGTVTGEPQAGNPRPRMFRLPKDQALLNRMGFNNLGSQAMAARLDRLRSRPTIIGVNIGKTKVVPNDEAVADYEKSFRRLYDFADYFVVNVSSPNTPGLRELQSREPLTALLSRLQEVNSELADRSHRRRPLLVKIAPDLTEDAIDEVLDVIDECRLDGIVAANTTINRGGLLTPKIEEFGNGGLSGRPSRRRALEVVRHIRDARPELAIIGVGGVYEAKHALDMLQAGADLIQVWTGFIYEGPTIVRDINRGLVAACRERGWNQIADCRNI